MHRYIVLLFLLAGVTQTDIPLPIGSISPQTGLLLRDEVTVKLIQMSSGDLAFDSVSQLALWDRSQLTEGYRNASQWVAQKAKEYGLQEVSIEQFPSDGRASYFGHPTQPAWIVRRGELWLKSPEEIKLASYAELPMSLYWNSSAADVETELIDVGDGSDDDDYTKDVRGKIILTSSDPAIISERAVRKHGVAGIVSYWSVPAFDYPNRRPGDFPDQIGWAGITPPTSEQLGTFAFLISSKQAEDLKILLRTRKKVRVSAVVDTELKPGTLDIVSGVIRGTRFPQEEIIVTAHLDHHKPGANDNASGCASTLEMSRALNMMIRQKIIPPPLRTIRFLWVPEWHGTRAWCSRHIQAPVKRLVNLNYDMLGQNLAKTNSIFLISYTPDFNPSYLNAVMESILDFMNKFNDERYPERKEFQIISLNGSRNRLQGRMMLYQQASDYLIFNELHIPATFVNSWPDDFYHSNQDTADKVDPTQLHRAVFSGLAAMTTIAFMNENIVDDLARLVFMYGQKRIQTMEFRAMQILASSSQQELASNQKLAGQMIRHVHQREKAALKSCEIFGHSRMIARLISMLAKSEAVSLEMGGTKAEIELTVQEQHAAKLVPSRKQNQELRGSEFVFAEFEDSAVVGKIQDTFDQAARKLKAQGADDFRTGTLSDAPVNYVDGHRSILEISDAIAAEYVPIPIEILIDYFRLFEKAGVVSISTH